MLCVIMLKLLCDVGKFVLRVLVSVWILVLVCVSL